MVKGRGSSLQVRQRQDGARSGIGKRRLQDCTCGRVQGNERRDSTVEIPTYKDIPYTRDKHTGTASTVQEVLEGKRRGSSGLRLSHWGRSYARRFNALLVG